LSSRFLENFQKLPGSSFKVARRHMQFCLIFWAPDRNHLAMSLVSPGDANYAT